MFKTYSSEQFQRVIGVVSLLTAIPVGNLNTTISTLLALVAVGSQIWGFITRWRKGDLSPLGFRKQ